MADQSFPICAFTKGQDEVRVSLSEFKGARYLDVRLWYKPKDGGEHKPTKEGVTLGLNRIKELRQCLEEAEKTAKEKGWL